MKKLIFTSITALFAGSLLLTSCAKEDPTPDPGTTNTDPRARFVATWSIAENSHDFGTSTYAVAITDSSDANYIQFGYLYGFNKKIYATVSSNNFTIPSQVVQGNNVTGNGVLAGANQINMTYYVQSTLTHFDTVTAVLTK